MGDICVSGWSGIGAGALLLCSIDLARQSCQPGFRGVENGSFISKAGLSDNMWSSLINHSPSKRTSEDIKNNLKVSNSDNRVR